MTKYLLTAMLASASLAFGQPEGGGRDRPDLGLDPEQQEQIVKLRDEFHVEAIDLRADLQKLRLALRQQMSVENPNRHHQRHGRPHRRQTGRFGKVAHKTEYRSPRSPHSRPAPHIRRPPLQARQGPLPGPPFSRPPAGLVAAPQGTQTGLDTHSAPPMVRAPPAGTNRSGIASHCLLNQP